MPYRPCAIGCFAFVIFFLSYISSFICLVAYSCKFILAFRHAFKFNVAVYVFRCFHYSISHTITSNPSAKVLVNFVKINYQV